MSQSSNTPCSAVRVHHFGVHSMDSETHLVSVIRNDLVRPSRFTDEETEAPGVLGEEVKEHTFFKSDLSLGLS